MALETGRRRKPAIIVSRTDHERLSRLAESVGDRNPAVADALLAELDRARVVADDRLRVRHYQCEPVEPTMELFFHNGRAIAAIRRPYMAAHDWARVVAPHLLAGYRTARTLRRVWGKPFRGEALRATPYIALLHLAHTVGEGVGYLYGPGVSGRHLH